MADDKLNVIALISGGKDSFFSLLHCRANGHRVVALANLHPAAAATTTTTNTAITVILDPASAAAAISAPVLASPPHDAGPVGVVPGGAPGNEVDEGPRQDEDEHDLNSFMYQTVGHQVIPLYAEATGIPLYRRAIVGGVAQHGKDYSPRCGTGVPVGPESEEESEDEDETESMLHLLETVKAAHPEANAVCAGAILSTYQRTRVESVATRLGLTPLAFLWKYPVLPAPATAAAPARTADDAQLLSDMAAAGLEARIIKVASGGLDDGFLWTNVADYAGKNRIARAMGRFGAAETGAVIGEGGEFETLVLDGPAALFKKRIAVGEEDRKVVREGGGSSWLSLRKAKLEDKLPSDGDDNTGGEQNIRIPDLLDPKFVGVLNALSTMTKEENMAPKLQALLQLQDAEIKETTTTPLIPFSSSSSSSAKPPLQHWTFSSSTCPSGQRATSIQQETSNLVSQIRLRLSQNSLPSQAIISSTILLRSMSDFALINPVYASLFSTDGPNPPSRVCVATGDSSLPPATNCNIVIILAVQTGLSLDAKQQQQRHRQGLHVQSRSYWAPANIGPYSQAVWFPLFGGEESQSQMQMVSTAGQIPLVPRTMALPPAEDLKRDAVLALQHLWRVGIDTGVKFWSFGVAYFPAAPAAAAAMGQETMEEKARLAGRVWGLMHEVKEGEDEEDEEDEDEGGPDLWDARFNSAYVSYAQDRGKGSGADLPDWSVVKGGRGLPPPVFAAEVEELPRGAGVEWQGGLGIKGAKEGEVEVRGVEGGRVWQIVVVVVGGGGDGSEKRFVQSVVVERYGDQEEKKEWEGQKDAAVAARYVDASVYPFDASEELPVVPCKSLWDGKGGRLKAVTVYQGVV
ncbi:hypothetical protein QBC44DRAFT_379037 [Cladorrhinum sp. PSN332]|nr:hypothetical protein QBC44DRAFT_379037 [Cladorrhinum sp. PSN332]